MWSCHMEAQHTHVSGHIGIVDQFTPAPNHTYLHPLVYMIILTIVKDIHSKTNIVPEYTLFTCNCDYVDSCSYTRTPCI
jgi:hypothetical protein